LQRHLFSNRSSTNNARDSYDVRWTTASDHVLLGEDGEASDREWRRAQWIAWGEAPYGTSFGALWNDRALFLRFVADDRSPWHTMTSRDDRIWEEEVVEIFLDPSGSGVNYAELEINHANVVCDLVVTQPWPELRSDPGWHFANLRTTVIDRAGAASPGWTAHARVPWEDFQTLPTDATLPPPVGSSWRFNVYRIKRPNGPARPHEGAIYAAWSPTGGPSFHVPAAFRPFRFMR
jgi:hypothetical protein